MNDVASPVEPRIFRVRFGPEKPGSLNEEWPNNVQLAGTGTAAVSRDGVLFSDGRNASGEHHRTFVMADIANVGYGENDTGYVVAVRTRTDDREVLVWMASKEEAQELLQLLPRTATPGFIANQEHHRKFRENLAKLSPKARVTPAIIGINVVIFLLMVFAGANIMQGDAGIAVRFGSDFGPLTWNGQPWRLLTAAFIHFGILHLAFNMYALYNGGMWTERLYGSTRFAVIYLLAALAGSMVSGWWNPLRNSAGASGAIFGVYGALLVFFWRRPADLPRDLLKSVRSGAISLCVYSLAMGAVMPFVDNAAHVGGLLGGALAGLLLVRPFEAEARRTPQPARIGVVILVFCLMLGALAAAIMARKIAPPNEVAQSSAGRTILAEQARIEAHFHDLLDQVQRGKLAPAAAAAAIRADVISPWRQVNLGWKHFPRFEAGSTESRWLDQMRAYAAANGALFAKTAERLDSPGPLIQSAEEADALRRVTEVSAGLAEPDGGNR